MHLPFLFGFFSLHWSKYFSNIYISQKPLPRGFVQNEQVERRKKCVVPVKLKLQTHSTTILQSSIHTIYISDAYKMLSLFGG